MPQHGLGGAIGGMSIKKLGTVQIWCLIIISSFDHPDHLSTQMMYYCGDDMNVHILTDRADM